MRSIRSKLVTVAAIGAAALGGGALANAATSTTASSSSSSSAPHAHSVNAKTEKSLSGDTASKVRAAALAKVPGTVERVETNVDSSAPYEAHIRKSDGTEAEVQVGSDYTVRAVNTMGGHP